VEVSHNRTHISSVCIMIFIFLIPDNEIRCWLFFKFVQISSHNFNSRYSW